MPLHTVLIIDDEKGFVEALKDALTYQGYRVLTSTTASDALHTLETSKVDVATVDIMMPPGEPLETSVDSHTTGVFLCQTIKKRYPNVGIICISVVTDQATITHIRKLGITFLKKGEVPLRTVLSMIHSKATGFAYSTDPGFNRRR